MLGPFAVFEAYIKRPFVKGCNTNICGSCTDAQIIYVQQGTKFGAFVRSLGRIPRPLESRLPEGQDDEEFDPFRKVLGN